eukprot:CAMPEP_0182429464 /NCGR_PEP_ID=MMETSP1167-20130531/29295_1 /TAXON_ID=2988 /ORGANISM="Mallomonas Sp, Strain CCMP3275" /LENGTH=125 /DNA_ID=CAMNT_0024613187 /DNA_START=295 /DNA_END=670 /DNA_ORIENTATION=-
MLLRGDHFSTDVNSSDPYKILGVSKKADAKEIKAAYFKAAKKYHPDMNPNDPTAKAKFQKVAYAFEILSDEKSRRRYDSTGRTDAGDTSSSYGARDRHQYQQPNRDAEEIFQSVWDDVNIVKEAW